MTKRKIIAIAGPSSSGKTKLAIWIAKAINGEIISVDSRQIYKGLNIGAAKPTEEEKQGIPHYMLDIIDVTQDYTVADYCDEADKIIKDIIKRGKVPVLAGGTGLYYRVLLQDFDLPRVAPDNELRAELNKLSSEELYKKLQKADIEISKKIHPNNKVKIIRALEVCNTLKVPMSEAQKKKENPYNTLWIGLNSENRDFLYGLINKRVEEMFEKGLIFEAKNLFEKYGENKILLSTIGYQEIYPLLKGETDLDSAKEQLKQNTRRYAKRQISWFNANKDINWFDIEKADFDEIQEEVLQMYSNV